MAKTEQILKIGEDIETKGRILEESWKNPWKISILEYLGEFQWFWDILEERKQEGRALDT